MEEMAQDNNTSNAQIKQVVDVVGQPISPYTHVHAVYDSEGRRLDQILSNINSFTGETNVRFETMDAKINNFASIEGETLIINPTN